MAPYLGNNVGLTIPGRPSTPCNGRAQVRPIVRGTHLETNGFHQYYRRPGDPMKQVTRTFANGTTLTFGPEVGFLIEHVPWVKSLISI